MKLVKNNVYKATKRIIDSVWTTKFLYLGDNTIEIIAHGRDDEDGYELEHELPQIVFKEDYKRTVRSVLIDDFVQFRLSKGWEGVQEFKVANPQHVFSYEESPSS
jgi:hypothetical protein